MYPCLVVSHSPAFVDQASSDSLIEENEETPREAEVQAVARRKLGVILQCHCRGPVADCKIPYKQWEHMGESYDGKSLSQKREVYSWLGEIIEL